MLNFLIRYPDRFEPKHYGSTWIGFIPQELLTVQGKGKGKIKFKSKIKGKVETLFGKFPLLYQSLRSKKSPIITNTPL
jgi:hypothetical protein